jgi:hypothetical protein
MAAAPPSAERLAAAIRERGRDETRGPVMLRTRASELAKRLADGTGASGGAGQLSGEQAAAATVVLARYIAGVRSKGGTPGARIDSVLAGGDWAWLREHVVADDGFDHTTLRDIKLPDIDNAQAAQCATFVAQNIDHADAADFRDLLKIDAYDRLTKNVGLPKLQVVVCDCCFGEGGGVCAETQRQNHAKKSGHSEAVSRRAATQVQAIAVTEAAALQRSVEARIERKHVRQYQRQGRVLTKQFNSSPEELAAVRAVTERGAMMQLKAWSLKKRTGQPVDPGEVSASSVVTGSSGDSLNTVEQQNQARLSRPRARTVQAARPQPAAAAPRTRGQKRSADEASVYEDPWWQHVPSKVDYGSDNETSTGNSPRAPSTRSSLAVWDADEAVQRDKELNLRERDRETGIDGRYFGLGVYGNECRADYDRLYNAGATTNKYLYESKTKALEVHQKLIRDQVFAPARAAAIAHERTYGPKRIKSGYETEVERIRRILDVPVYDRPY